MFCSSTACKTSHRHLFSLQAGFHVWVLPYGPFPGTAAFSAVTCENVTETPVCFEIKCWDVRTSL